MKFRVSWWFKDTVQGLRRGKDIVEADQDFDEEDAREIMAGIMETDSALYQKMPNFAKNVHSPCPVSWNPLKIVRLKDAEIIGIEKKDLFALWMNVTSLAAEIEGIAEEVKLIDDGLHRRIEQSAVEITAEFGKLRRKLKLKDWWELDEKKRRKNGVESVA